MEIQIITLPIEVNELAVKVSANKQAEVQAVLQQIFTGTDGWEKQVDAINVKDINDKMSIELAEVARKNSKQARLSAEKIFDAKREEVQNLKAEFDLEDKLWLKAKQVMQIKFKAIEEKAEWKANFVKRFEAEQKELRTQKRINEVSKFGEINRIEFEAMSDESFNSFLSGLKSTYEAKIEADRKAEEERLAQIEAEKQRQLAIEAENKRLKAEAEEKEKALIIERKKQQEILEEANRKAKAEAEEKIRLQKEIDDKKAKELAELKKKELQEKALKSAPDKEKLEKLALSLKSLVMPDLSTNEAKEILKNIKTLIEKTVIFINTKADSLTKKDIL